MPAAGGEHERREQHDERLRRERPCGRKIAYKSRNFAGIEGIGRVEHDQRKRTSCNLPTLGKRKDIAHLHRSRWRPEA